MIVTFPSIQVSAPDTDIKRYGSWQCQSSLIHKRQICAFSWVLVLGYMLGWSHEVAKATILPYLARVWGFILLRWGCSMIILMFICFVSVSMDCINKLQPPPQRSSQCINNSNVISMFLEDISLFKRGARLCGCAYNVLVLSLDIIFTGYNITIF